jgi:F0F1-type ATP synthase membrane subunit c/vacuolar-type H+-ATPase subunit K
MLKKFFFFYYATIVTRLTNTGLIRAVVGIGVVFGALILGVASYPSLRGQLFFLCYF